MDSNYYQRIEQGVCVYCGERKARPGRRMCPQCALKATDRQIKRNKLYHKLRTAAGLCIHCGVAKADEGYVSCAKCREKDSKCNIERYHKAKGETV